MIHICIHGDLADRSTAYVAGRWDVPSSIHRLHMFGSGRVPKGRSSM